MGKSKVDEKQLAINGGEKTITEFSQKAEPKIWIEEIIELLDLWKVPADAKSRIGDILGQSELSAAHLFRYYNENSKVVQFEKEFREMFGVNYALAVNSGTSALIAAMVACEVGPGKEVIVPAYTFFASAASVVTAKGIPVIAEVDESLTLDPHDVENKITENTQAIVPVHMAGMPCDMDAIMEIARKHKLRVIEDVAQAGGGSYHGKRLGAIGDCNCFSLDFFKVFVSGEGGVVATDDEWLFIRAQSYHDTAACWRPDRYARERMSGELFCGENYRMSELQGAVALAQLHKTDQRVQAWRKNKQRIIAQLGNFNGMELQPSHDPEGEAGYTLTFFVPSGELAKKISQAIAAEGVSTGKVYSSELRDWHVYTYWEHILDQKTATAEGCPFTCPYHKGPLPEYSPDMCPRTLDLLDRSVRVSIGTHWTEQDCDLVAKAINKVLAAYLGPVQA